ncbi:MAG: preprotein translocase subunit YajC [Phycisphaerales bacterium]
MLTPTDDWQAILSPTLAFQDTPRGVLGGDGGNATEGQPIGEDGAGAPPAGGLGNFFLPIMLGVLLLMIFTTVTSGRRQKKERQQLMNSLGKHDKVQTSAGIIGTIVELKDDSVLLRVDETSNTRIRFARSAVAQVLHSAGKGSSEPAEDATEDTNAVA